MSSGERIPQPGDVLRLDFDPTVGTEQGGPRPALVISSAAYNVLSGRALVLPITRRVRGWATEVLIPLGLPVRGVILTDQARTIDWRARSAVWLASLEPKIVEAARDGLASLIERP